MAVAVPDTPQHDKLAARRKEHDTIVSFVQWLDAHDHFNVARWNYEAGIYLPITDRERANLIAEFFGIDREAYDAETVAVFNAVRAAAEAAR